MASAPRNKHHEGDPSLAAAAASGAGSSSQAAAAGGDGDRKEEVAAIPIPPPPPAPTMASGPRNDDDGHRQEPRPEQREGEPSLAAAVSGAVSSSQAAADGRDGDQQHEAAAIPTPTPPSAPTMASGPRNDEDDHLDELVSEQEERDQSLPAGGDEKGKRPEISSTSSSSSTLMYSGTISDYEERQAERLLAELERQARRPADSARVLEGLLRPDGEEEKVIPSKNPLTLAKRGWHKVTDEVKSKLSVNEDNIWTRALPRSWLFDDPSESHVSRETIPMIEAVLHYHPSDDETREPLNIMHLQMTYHAFRPVLADGECFYRSFIFAYLELVLARQDKHEEDRLLAALRSVTTQYQRLGWPCRFSRLHKAFKRLIRKVKRWKRARILIKPSTESYRKKKLLKFFKGHTKTAANYEPLVAESDNLEEWCKNKVLPPFEYADNTQMRALASALGVPLRVVPFKVGPDQDFYTLQHAATEAPGPSVTSSSTMTPPPPAAAAQQAPRVALLYRDVHQHYDIIYPR